MTEYKIADENEVLRCFDLRIEVFVKEQKVPLELELDELDDEAVHVIVLEDKNILACGRLVELDDYMKVGRIAVKKDQRGKGIGLKLVSFLTEMAKKSAKPIVLDAQVRATGFYKKLGYVEKGDVFMDAGIPHIKMVYKGE